MTSLSWLSKATQVTSDAWGLPSFMSAPFMALYTPTKPDCTNAHTVERAEHTQ